MPPTEAFDVDVEVDDDDDDNDDDVYDDGDGYIFIFGQEKRNMKRCILSSLFLSLSLKHTHTHTACFHINKLKRIRAHTHAHLPSPTFLHFWRIVLIHKHTHAHFIMILCSVAVLQKNDYLLSRMITASPTCCTKGKKHTLSHCIIICIIFYITLTRVSSPTLPTTSP